jgi:hypothetical protein
MQAGDGSEPWRLRAWEGAAGAPVVMIMAFAAWQGLGIGGVGVLCSKRLSERF